MTDVQSLLVLLCLMAKWTQTAESDYVRNHVTAGTLSPTNGDIADPWEQGYLETQRRSKQRGYL